MVMVDPQGMVVKKDTHPDTTGSRLVVYVD